MISAGSGKGRMQRRTSSFFDDASPMMLEVRAERRSIADLSMYEEERLRWSTH